MKSLPKKIIRLEDGMEFLLNVKTQQYRIHLGIPRLDDSDHLHHEYSYERLMLDPRNKGKFKVADGSEDIEAMKKRWLDSFKKADEYNTMKDIKSHLGLKRSIETRKKMSISQTGKTHSKETKEKLKKLATGVKQSKETVSKRMKNLYKPILQYDLNGNLVKEWESATHASLSGKYKRKCIYRCIWGERPHYKKFIWKEKC